MSGAIVRPLRLDSALDFATRMARESADSGPTGYGAVCTTGDDKIIVLRAPSQAEDLVAPTTIVVAFGDGTRADAIWQGHKAEYELGKARGR